MAVGAALWCAPGALASGWCGTGEAVNDRPDIVTGQQIHAIVAVPADGPDTFAADSGHLADDVASIDSWWIGQDPTREPRFDLASFPAGPCLDISFLRLPQTADGLAAGGSSQAFTLLIADLYAAGFDQEFKKYLIYYDGAPVDDSICGTGEGAFATGPAYAVVWLSACSGIPTDATAAHELLHALGALPAGAPNACTPQTDPAGIADPGHPCDSPTDVLYPYATGAPLSQLVLDYHHDDYYAHSGSWPDIQDSFWLRHLNTPEIPLAVTLAGHGEVSSDLPGLDCFTSCTTQWDQNTKVTLAATPATGMRFIGWQGGTCTGTDPCTISLASATAVTASFGPARVAMHLSVAGRGRIACRPQCGATAAAGQLVVLSAVPAKGWRFVRWSGTCKGARTTCRVSPTAAFAARATFAKKPVTAKKPRR